MRRLWAVICLMFFPTATNKICLFKTFVCIVCIPLYLSYLSGPNRGWRKGELIFSGAMSQLETDQWIQNMEDHMENNPIVGHDMTQHALQCFEIGATTWWRMYQTHSGWQRVNTWKEFKLTLLKSRFVSQKFKALWKWYEETFCMQALWRNRTHP